MHRSFPCLLAIMGGLGAFSARAHDADVIYVQLEKTVSGAGWVETVTMTTETLLELAPVDRNGNGVIEENEWSLGASAIEEGVWNQALLRSDMEACVRLKASGSSRDPVVALTAVFDCPEGELNQNFKWLTVLPANYRIIARLRQGDQTVERMASGIEQTLFFVVSETSRTGAGFLSWVSLGTKHIFEGLDHLAFLLAIVVVASSWRKVIGWMTAFTVAHSLTLMVAASGFLRFTDVQYQWVEFLIALSIVAVALENIGWKEHRHRVWLTFVFGLIHGLGFASVLSAYELGPSWWVDLAGFNVGVEIGQVVLIAVLFPFFRRLSQTDPNQRGVRITSLCVMAVGLYWVSERLYSLFV